MPLGMDIDLSPGDCVKWGPSPLPKRGQSPQFLAHVYRGQTPAWIKMPLGTEVGLDLDDIVLDGDPAPPPQKGGGSPSPVFSSCLWWPNGWMHQDATWYGGRPQPSGLCVKCGPSPLPQKDGGAPQFSAHVYCLLWPNGWIDQDATWY